MRWDHPTLLWAIPALALVVAWLARRMPGSRRRRLARFLARTAVLGLAVAALAGPHTQREVSQPRRLVLAVDAAGREPLASARPRAARALGERLRDVAAAEDLTFDRIDYTTRPGMGTRPPPPTPDSALAAGLAAARLRFRAGETGGIVVLSDGRGDLGGARAAVDALRADGIRVTGVAVPETVEPLPPTPVIEALDVPAHARGPVAVRARAQDPAGRAHTLVLRVDGAPRAREERPAGAEGDVAFEALELAPGVHEVSLTLEIDGRGAALARRLVEVGTPPEALALFQDGSAGPWVRALETQGLVVQAGDAAALGRRLAAGPLPDLVVADAGSLAGLSAPTAGLLRDRVRDGLGLVLAAGTDAAAWGRLGTSPLASLLPLAPLPEPPPPRPEPPPPTDEPPPPPIDKPEEDEGKGRKAERRPEEALPITLLLLVDRSGSMAGPIDKLNMAILGAQRAAQALSPWDRVGVITFASDVELAIPVRSARGATSLAAWLTGVEPDPLPGTDIAGALRMAREVMAGERSPIKHVILLTDGRQYPSGPIFGPIVKPMAAQGITITAVGIGRGSHTGQLREIVQWAARGHLRTARTPAEIPRILTRDTEQVAEKRRVDAEAIEARLPDERTPPTPEVDEPAPTDPPPPTDRPRDPTPRDTEEGPATDAPPQPLVRRRAHEALAGFEDAAWPAVGRPRRAELRPGGVVLLARGEDEPVLAASRAGLGRVLAWALPSDDAGTLGWQPLGRLFAQIGRAVLAPEGAFAWLPRPRVVQTPDGAHLHVDWPAGVTDGAVEARWVGPAGEPRSVGVFTPGDDDGGRPLPRAPAGARCRIELIHAGGPAPAPLSYLVAPDTRRDPQPADARALAAALGGALESPAPFARTLPTRTRTERSPRWRVFLWLLVLLLPLDVFLHRRTGGR